MSRGRRGRPRALAGGNQRARALAAAVALLREVGYAAMTMDAVARRAGLSKKTLYEVFTSKSRLMGALVEAHRRSILALPHDGDEPPELAIRAIFRVDRPEADHAEQEAIIHLIINESRAFPELRGILVAHGPHIAEAELASWIDKQVRRGKMVADDPHATACVLLDVMFGALLPRPLPTGRIDRMQRIATAIRIFLDGTRIR